jgi:hypothetical protein
MEDGTELKRISLRQMADNNLYRYAEPEMN